MPDTNRAVQPYKMARDFKFRIKEVEGSYYIYVAKTKALISFAVTVKSFVVTATLVCVFAYVKSRFSHDAAQIIKGERQIP